MPFKPDTAKIKRWREERQWSQEHVAELAGVGLRTIQRLESGGQASQETLKALAAAYDVDVSALALDPEEQAAEIVQTRNGKTRAALRLSLWIHLASYAIGAVVFLGISWGLGYFAMKWPLIWWTVGAVAHAATVVIVEVATRYSEQWQRD
ncbi:MAG: helix-turn-helix transcriptional regulator [Pseudomonadota bacterium]|nr:helix-turn-helix transcriptional regulator [Pseudomonadota bacterium]